MKAMNSGEMFGGEVQYFRLEPRFWKPVISRMVEAGIRSLSTYVPWSIHQVEGPSPAYPAGKLDFEGKTDPRLNVLGFMDMVQEAGLLMSFRCGPFCCNELDFGGHPRFLVCGHRNMMVWNHVDELTPGYWISRREGWQPSYLHPDYLSLCRAWLEEIAAVIRPRLRSNGGIIDLVNLDNEVSYIVRDGFLDSDYNPVNVRPGGFWHQFLAEKYGDASDLPYGTTYGHIDEVRPPREVPDDVTTDIARHLDWVEFKEWVMCRYIATLRSMHEANGVRDVVFTTNLNPHLPEGVPTRMPSFERAVKGSGRGVVGYDFYRGTFLSWSGYSSMARVLKLMNASVDYTWSSEFMSGTWNKDLSDRGRVSDEHMRFMARCALAHGCKSISWFMFHDRCVWGDAPVSSHGHARTSLSVIRETRNLCHEKIPHWDELVPQADCAVIYDVTAHRHTAVGDPSPCSDSRLHVGRPHIAGVQAGETSREYVGLYRVIEAGGCQADAVDILARPERLLDYRLAFLPGGPLVSAAALDGLLHWIRRGGTLVVSGSWPSFDESGRAVEFLGLQDPGEGELRIGEGRLIRRAWLAPDAPEREDLGVVERVQKWIRDTCGPATVHIRPARPVQWKDWKNGAGVDNAATRGGDELDNRITTEQPRTLASAVLHDGGGFPVVFVLNHYPEAAEFELTFGSLKPTGLRCLDTDDVIPVLDGKVKVDIDRKSAAIYAVEDA